MSAALKPHAKFSGTFNADKTELTIEKLPIYDWETKKVTEKKAVFTKMPSGILTTRTTYNLRDSFYCKAR